MNAKLLIVDDERVALKNLEYVMKKEGYEVVSTQSGSNAIRYLEEQLFDVVLTDMRMERVDGMQVLRRCRELQPDAEIIMITGYATLETAVETMKHGAFSYIAKPFKLDEVRKTVREAVQKVQKKKGYRDLKERFSNYQGAVEIITTDSAMHKPLETARQIAQADSNVFITGESGTGKKLFAEYIHAGSRRSAGQFVAVRCGAFTEELLTEELFGHEPGAALGGPAEKKGALEAASGGTLYLGEITRMPLPIQAKLMQVIETRQVQRIGGAGSIPVDVRFIVGTEGGPAELGRDDILRQDLYYRLNVVSLHLPRLSERKADIPLLAFYFLKKYSLRLNKTVTDIADDVMSLFLEHEFPGNVRELETVIERGVALTNSTIIEMAHVPDSLRELSVKSFRKKDGRIPSLESQEMEYIKWVLHEVGGNKTLAAQILGIDRVSLWRKLKKYGLDGQDEGRL